MTISCVKAFTNSQKEQSSSVHFFLENYNIHRYKNTNLGMKYA